MHTPTRRAFLAATSASVAALSGCSASDSTVTPTEGALRGLELSGERVASGFDAPVDVVVPRSGEFFVADQFGEIRYFDGAKTAPAAITDLTDRLADPGGEMGLLGIALHPEYDGSGRMYVRYSAPLRAGMPSNYSHRFVLSEFRVSGGRLDRDSERMLLEIPEPQINHNAGAVGFGPDGYLYVGVGDGGAANDQGRGHVDDWYDAVEGGNGQDVTENLLGSLLRIDVDSRDADRPYGVPEDNPLVGQPGLDEQYAWGFRNPWRFSFGPDGRLFVADVGQSSYEEINVVERGGNYGWNVREGRSCVQAEECPTTGPEGDPLVDPVIQYPHEGDGITGISVIGGYVYDGPAIPSLQGRYVFADYVAEGELFVGTEGDDGWSLDAVPVSGIQSRVLSFGRTPAGELLVCSTGDSGGAVHRIRAAEATAE
ncbi:PQQ-dependent sugar dehydrogenase [Haloarcula onubensis]|uniref:PQQ-dependent sugar dehydrogenase n=1 Tax=Haloarcula onubensis TaxID=2950539 RepID=A0ABU2FN01_9EURY|nr:PQQ-dependent sugar dehydrogenase [Halomicroarcula sp. S3CR25-11]MDS0281681.1 PQQ-dependent sugar dehydrogenase [Halomicroarcula sp. S3CR25-11]